MHTPPKEDTTQRTHPNNTHPKNTQRPTTAPFWTPEMNGSCGRRGLSSRSLPETRVEPCEDCRQYHWVGKLISFSIGALENQPPPNPRRNARTHAQTHLYVPGTTRCFIAHWFCLEPEQFGICRGLRVCDSGLSSIRTQEMHGGQPWGEGKINPSKN